MKIREDLKELFLSNPITTPLTMIGPVLLFLYPVIMIICRIARAYEVMNNVSALFYIIYLVGFIACFACSYDLLLAIACGINMIRYIIQIIDYFTFDYCVYILFYIALAIFFIRNFMLSHNMSISRGPAGGSDVIGGAKVPMVCPDCGYAVENGAAFCPNCGHRFVAPSPKPPTPYGTGIESVAGSILALVFSIFVTLNIVFSFVNDFSIIKIFTMIPGIIICIGVWIIFAQSKGGQVKTTGFTLISGVMIFDIIITALGFIGAIGIFVVLIGALSGTDAMPYMIMCLAIILIYAALNIYYYVALRRTSTSAKGIILGSETEWKASLYVIFLMIIKAIFGVVKFIALIAVSGTIYSYLSSMMNELNYALQYTGNSQMAMNALNYAMDSLFGGSGPLGYIAQFINLATLIIAIVILFQIRARNKY